jgi:hypothetical protein
MDQVPGGTARRVAQPREIIVNGVPDFGPAGQSSPFGSDQTNQRVAAINRDSIIFARAVGAVDKECLYVRLKLRQHSVGFN